MTQEYEFVSPLGGEIAGTKEIIGGYAKVDFNSNDRSFSHCYGTEVDWDGQETDMIDKVPIFVDESGNPWLQHHLIQVVDGEAPTPLSEATIRLIREEIAIGTAMETTRLLECQLEAIGPTSKILIANLKMSLELSYKLAKGASLIAIAEELGQ